MGIVFVNDGEHVVKHFFGGAQNTTFLSCGIDNDDGKSGTISDLDE